MTWDIIIVLMLRHMIDDLDAPYTYSDSRLKQLIALAAQKVLSYIETNIDYTVVFSLNPTISPDPITENDIGFVDLITLKAACMIDHIETKKAIDNAILFRDGESWGDTRDVGKHRAALLKIGACKEFEDALLTYQLEGVSTIGLAVMGPFRVYASGFHSSKRDSIDRRLI